MAEPPRIIWEGLTLVQYWIAEGQPRVRVFWVLTRALLPDHRRYSSSGGIEGILQYLEVEMQRRVFFFFFCFLFFFLFFFFLGVGEFFVRTFSLFFAFVFPFLGRQAEVDRFCICWGQERFKTRKVKREQARPRGPARRCEMLETTLNGAGSQPRRVSSWAGASHSVEMPLFVSMPLRVQHSVDATDVGTTAGR